MPPEGLRFGVQWKRQRDSEELGSTIKGNFPGLDGIAKQRDYGMHVYRIPDLSPEIGRQHPWTYSVKNPAWKYYDFKTHPQLISQVLEDFKKLEHELAVERFYRFLEWLNGSDSCLESNDCGLRDLQDNTDNQFPKRRRILGRLMVLFRREDINYYDQNSNWLLGCFEFHLARTKPDFFWGAVELARFPTLFTSRGVTGHVLQMQFFSYGDSDGEVLANLDQLIAGIQIAALEVNRQVRESGLCPVTKEVLQTTA
jgi:hypothetical protein